MQPRLLDDEVTFDAAARTGPAGRVLVVACGAIAREVLAVIDLNGWTHVTLQCLPGKLHNTPREIAGKVDAKLREAEASGDYDAMFVAYGDCGTAGALDDVLAAHGVDRLPGDHCYGFFAGVDEFAAMHEDNPFTFYLTDFLCRHFDRLVVQGLKLDYPSRAAADVLRELPATGVPVADRRPRVGGARTGRGGVPGSRVRASSERVRRPAAVAGAVRGRGAAWPLS